MNPQATAEDLRGKTFREALMTWLFNQATSTILLVGILIAIGYSAYWCVNVGIPAHIKQLNDANAAMNAENNRVHVEQSLRHEETIKQIITSHEKDTANKDKQILQLWDMIFNIRQKPEKAAMPIVP